MEMNAIDTMRAAPAEASFTIGRDALAPALDFLARIIERRNTIPILSNVLLVADPAEGLTLIGTDLDIMGTVQLLAAVDSPGRFTVELETLRDFVRKVPKRDSAGVPQISFSEHAGRVTVAAGRARSTLHTIKASDFPIMRALENAPAAFDGDASTWLHDLDRVGRAISTEETRYYLNGIFVHVRDGALAMAATDGHRLARIVRPLPEGAAELPDGIIPRKTVGLLSRLLKAEGGTFRAYMNATRVAFQAGAYRLDSKLIDGSFPDYARVIPDADTFEHALTIDAAAIIATTDGLKRGRAKTASAEMLAIDADADRLVYGNVGPDGAFAAPLDATYSGPGGRFGFNAGYLRDVGAIFAAGPVTFRAADPNAPVLVQSDSAPELTFVQMPMRRDDPLPEPVAAPVAPVYEAPDGQAADLWGVLPHGARGPNESLSSLCHERPRSAFPKELEAYARDYARRCGLAGADRLAIAALGSGRMQFGKCVAEARTAIVERLNWETLATESEAVQIAAEYETGAFCLTLPGGGRQAPVTVSLDGGPEQVVAADHAGDVRKALTAIMGPDVKLSRAEKAALKERDRARNAPVQPDAVEPVRKPKAAAVKRAERALAMLTGARSGMGTRAFDDCFEMGDGADVAAVMVERIRGDRELAQRVYYGRSRVRDGGEGYFVHAASYLSPALWAAVLDSIGNMPTSAAWGDVEFHARIDALRVNRPADPEAAAYPAPREVAPDARDISAPEPENVLSEPEIGPADDISAQPDTAPAEPGAADDLAARVAALESLVSQLLSGRTEAAAVADAPESRERRRDDPARLRMIRRYLAMRAERASLLKQNGALRQKRRSLIGLALSLRSALLRSRRSETAARTEARTATRAVTALQDRAARLQRRVDGLEQWEEDSRERITPPAPRTFPSLRMVKG